MAEDWKPELFAADTANMQAGASSSFLDNATNFAGAAIVSGFQSIYNTGASWIGEEKVDTAKWLMANDAEMGAFYQRNKDSVDTAGFIATSLIPGSLALKGLQLAKAGTALGPFGRALGYASGQRDIYLNEAIKDISQAGGTIFNQINRNKMAAMTWGAADNILQVAAFETAVAITMKQSPLLEKEDWVATTGNILKTSVAFGLLGGTLEAIGIQSAYKGASKLIDTELEKYNRLILHENAMPDGSKAYLLLESMLGLKKEGENLKYLHRYLPSKEAMVLPTAEAFDRARDSATRFGWNKFRELTNKISGDDAELGGAFSHAIEKRIAELQQGGTTTENILDEIKGYLLNVKQIRRVPEDASKGIGDLFYVADKLPLDKLKTITSVDQFLSEILTRAPTGPTTKKVSEIVGDLKDIKIGVIGDAAHEGGFARFSNSGEAFEAGYDAVINGIKIEVNPRSTRILHYDDPIIRPRQFFHIPTNSFTFTAYPTVADLATSTRPLNLVGGKDTVVAGFKDWKLTPFEEFKTWEMDSVRASARYAWLAMKDPSGEHYLYSVVPGRVRDTDLPMLERIYQEGASKWKDVKLVGAADDVRVVGDIEDFGAFLMDTKLQMLQFQLAKHGPEDLASLAVKFNVDIPWLEKAIANNFVSTDALVSGFSTPLHRSLFPTNMEVRWDFSGNVKLSKELVAGTGAVPTKIGAKEVSLPANADKVMIQMVPDGVGNSIYGVLGTEYAIKLGKDQADNAFAAVFGAERSAQILVVDANTAIRYADQRGAGPSILGASNADYGDLLRLATQHQGNLTNIWIKERREETLSIFQPLFIKIADSKAASAELGMLWTALRRSSERFTIHPEDSSILVNIKALMKGDDGLVSVSKEKLKELEQANVRATLKMENEDVAEVMGKYLDWNRKKVGERKVLMAAKGWDSNWNPDVIHPIPLDMGRNPYFALVRQKEGFLGGSSEVVMITAKTDSQLRDLAAKVPREKYDVLFKSETSDWYRAKNSYDYQLTIKEPRLNSELQSQNILSQFFPETAPDLVVGDMVNYIAKQESNMVRLGVEVKNSQLFAELRALGHQFEQVATSKAQADIKKFKSQIANPYEEYIKLALDISKRSEYTLLHEANEFVESVGKTAYREFGVSKDKALSRMVTWEEANKQAEKFGISGPYSDPNIYFKANLPADRSITREFVSKANVMMVNFTLRLDQAQSIMNIISTPILLSTEMASIKNLINNDPELVGKLAELRSIQVPGENFTVPSTMKLLVSAIKNFWSPEKGELLKRYTELGAIKDTMSKYHEMIDHFSYKPWEKTSALVELGNKGVEIGAKFSGNMWAEEFTRFVSADVMKQLTDPILAAGKMSIQEQNAYISVFVNRVQGNYLASQRPIAFQGVLGAAVSLFQTYQFNLLQQLFRHVENGDKKAMFTLLGMQGGLYGLNGIPFFEAANNHLIGQSSLNPAHRDTYSTMARASTAITGSNDLGNWMMYGTASAFPFWSSQAPALYTRGDINPRHPTVLPISPTDIVAVDGSIRLVKNLIDMGQKLSGGAALGATLLEGLEHNGINRPLAGMAQIAGGASTTSKGGLIAASNDLVSIATAARLIGAKPMDESLALNTYFRLHGYMASDEQRLEQLGEVVKTKLRKNQLPTPEELHSFQLEYAKSGGRIENYSKALQRWSKDANTSIVNKMIQQHQSSYSQRLIEIMGGTALPDYRNNFTAQARLPQEAAAEPETVE